MLGLGLLAVGLAGCGFGGSSVSAQQAGDEVRSAGDGPTSGADVAAQPDVLEPGALVLARIGLPESPAQIDAISGPGGPAVTMSPSTTNVATGDAVEITVTFDPAGLSVTAFEVVIEADPSAVELVGIKAGELLGSGVIVGAEEFDGATGRGLVTVARRGTAEGPTGEGSVATVRLNVRDIAQAGASSVRVGVRATDDAFSLLGPYLASTTLTIVAR